MANESNNKPQEPEPVAEEPVAEGSFLYAGANGESVRIFSFNPATLGTDWRHNLTTAQAKQLLDSLRVTVREMTGGGSPGPAPRAR